MGIGEGEKRRNACYKNRDIRITANEFLVIDLCQLSRRSPIRKGRSLLRMADFMREFTMFTSQPELASWNFAAASDRALFYVWLTSRVSLLCLPPSAN